MRVFLHFKDRLFQDEQFTKKTHIIYPDYEEIFHPMPKIIHPINFQCMCSGGSKGGALGKHPSLQPKIFSISCSFFFGKLGSRGLAPPSKRNPGSGPMCMLPGSWIEPVNSNFTTQQYSNQLSQQWWIQDFTSQTGVSCQPQGEMPSYYFGQFYPKTARN